jgi:hypothetical protein
MSQLLEDAIALQELFSDDKTWIQEDLVAYRQDRGRECYCLLGGIDRVTGMLDDPTEWEESYKRSKALERVIESVIAGEYPEWTTHIPDWNDAEERTVQDVQDVCAKTVEAAKSNG